MPVPNSTTRRMGRQSALCSSGSPQSDRRSKRQDQRDHVCISSASYDVSQISAEKVTTVGGREAIEMDMDGQAVQRRRTWVLFQYKVNVRRRSKKGNLHASGWSGGTDPGPTAIAPFLEQASWIPRRIVVRITEKRRGAGPRPSTRLFCSGEEHYSSGFFSSPGPIPNGTHLLASFKRC